MYGSSRLGIKKYWPTQYRYEWSRAKTLAQNLAALDTNELNHRMAWYYGPWQSLVTPTEVVAAAHANRKNLSSTRIVGQKGYELTNHLGNVMAVVSDKVTDKPAVANASLPALVAKRAALSAAYDYYPFGMQMPGRVVEDATVQCIPVTRTRKVDKITSTEDLMITYSSSDLTAPKWTNSGSNTQVNYVPVTGGWRADLKSLNSTTAIDAYMTFRALPASTSGLIVSVTMAENNYPAYNYPFSPYTLTGTLTVELRNLASGGIGTFLVTGSRTASGSVLLTVPPGMVAGGNVIRLWMHYDGPPVPRANQPGNPPLTTPQSNISYTSVVSNVLQPVDQQYVALSCDTDGAYAATYRYGFNGQQKDDEMKGKGNSLDFGARMYDSRLGRFLSVDPLAETSPSYSSYHFAANSPASRIDIAGESDHYYTFNLFYNNGVLSLNLVRQSTDDGLISSIAGAITSSTGDRYFLFYQPDYSPDANSTHLTFETKEQMVTYWGLLAAGKRDFYKDAHDEEWDKVKGVVLSGVTNATMEVGEAYVANIQTSKRPLEAPSGTPNTALAAAKARAAKLSEKPRPGKDFTKAGKQAVKQVNTIQNNLQMTCVGCGQSVQNAKQHTSGYTPPGNEAHVDHIYPKSEGGSGTPNNGQILCRDCNLAKGAKTPSNQTTGN